MAEHPATPLRQQLIAALKADLIGPFDGHFDSTEELPLPPSRWYWGGFLAPDRARDSADPEADAELEAGDDRTEEEGGSAEPQAKRRKMFAASLGLSVLLPEHKPNDSLTVTVWFATYEALASSSEADAGKPATWRRLPQGPFTLSLPLDQASLQRGIELPEWPGVRIKAVLREAKLPMLDAGTRVLSVFLVNQRNDAGRGRGDQDFLFQVELELFYARGFVERPNRWGEAALDVDDRVSDLQYRDHCEWAVGHGVAVSAGPLDPASKRVQRVRTSFVPVSEVHGVRGVSQRECEVVSNMLELAELASRDDDGAALRHALMPLTTRYSEWITSQQAIAIDRPKRKETQALLVNQAREACDRIQRGIDRLVSDPQARRAFAWTNQVMAHAALQRSPLDYPDGKTPAWRTFQLAFVLLNLVDVADPHSAAREQVELIFFPTGGGKTEAYLGVIAFTLLLRRLHGQSRPDRGLGVAVLLRYTLRLLTLDQLGRAATLMCQLELLRQRESTLGSERFAVGLWVGRSATANTLDEVHKAILDYRSSTSEHATSPFPLANCPHCREPLGRDAITVQPSIQKPERVVVCCSNFRCEFSARKNRDGLPVLFVDEQIYRELPAFLVATVDKFAMLPWRGETGMLFGRAQAYQHGCFFGPMDGGAPKGATPLPDGLMPPELIVQDELHLIAGPLGTMVGLYETAIEFLCTRRGPQAAAADGKPGRSIKPKIIASTATVRRAQDQVEDLFGRSQMRLFPPQGVNAWDTFFAKPDLEKPGRLYVGVAAQGRSMRGSLIRCYASLLTAANKHYDKKGPSEQTADAFMTLVGYFNSLRELGGMRRLVEDDVYKRALSVEDRKPIHFKSPHPFSRKRLLSRDPVELTSRESTPNIKLAKDRLALPYTETKHVDVLLASNMISVGVDIDRLGLMVVAGQPKTTSEYIQASSRVGRKTPGLVITCYNSARPRDRSHYERFCTYHESFYRFVEAMSLTPLSGPALQRGLAGTLVAMARLGYPALTPGNAVMDIAEHRQHVERVVTALAARGPSDAMQQELTQRANKLFDAWENVVKATEADAGQRKYSRFDRDGSKGKELLFLATDQHKPDASSSSPNEARFQAPTSMRDVEATVPLWVTKSFGGKR